MILLIVDDQSNVVKGIMNGVDWATDGFKRVFPAYTAKEAKKILEMHKVDVMLCDIEMPIESGISLVEWAGQNSTSTKCIFLTSHMSFEYAQQALRLGCTDYLVLPAPYQDIRVAVQKAVGQLKSSHASKELSNYGLMMRGREDTVVESLFRHFLVTGDYADIKEGQALGRLPEGDVPCYLLIVQVIRQEIGIEKWMPGSLRYAINNIVNELFENYEQVCVGAEVGKNIMCYMVFGGKFTIDFDGVMRQMEFLVTFGKEHLNCVLACYTDNAMCLRDIPNAYKLFSQCMADNVAMQSGVFVASSTKANNNTATMSAHIKYSRWAQELASGYTAAVREASLTYLEELIKSEQLNVETLQAFYQNFTQMLSQALEKHGYTTRDLYTSRNAFEISHSGSKSAENMRHLIVFSLDELEKILDTQQGKSFKVENVVSYIHDNLEKDIRRSDLAGHFHLNPDYLTRLFKKEMGQNLKEFITKEKISAAKSLLRTTNLPIGMVAIKVGFSSFSHFSKIYLKTVGITPSEERQNAKDETDTD